jgi:transposase-like protein
MDKIKNEFRGRHFKADIILWAVRWYLQFPISYRDLERMLADSSPLTKSSSADSV